MHIIIDDTILNNAHYYMAGVLCVFGVIKLCRIIWKNLKKDPCFTCYDFPIKCKTCKHYTDPRTTSYEPRDEERK